MIVKSFFCGSIVLVVLFYLHSFDLSRFPAFEGVLVCMPQDIYVTFFYKLILSINFVVPVYCTFFLRPVRIFSEVKHLFSSFLVFFVAMVGLYIGVPIQTADGAASFFSNLFCGSMVGALFVVLMVGLGAFFCFLYFFYSCKCIWLSKINGEL